MQGTCSEVSLQIVSAAFLLCFICGQMGCHWASVHVLVSQGGFLKDHSYMPAYIHTSMHPCNYGSMYPSMHLCLRAYMGRCIHACMHTCIHAHIHISYIPYVLLYCMCIAYYIISVCMHIHISWHLATFFSATDAEECVDYLLSCGTIFHRCSSCNIPAKKRKSYPAAFC